MDKELAPLVLFVYNRPNETINILNCIDNQKKIENVDLFIFSDGAKNDDGKKAVDNVRNIIWEYEKKSKCKSVKIITSDKNKGLANSIISGVTSVIKQYGIAIVLEDDLTLAPDFLEYMMEALKFYSHNKKIWAISGYNYRMKTLDNYPHDVYLSGRPCSWGWATWENRWNLVDWSVSNYSKISRSPLHRYLFTSWGVDLPEMLDLQMNGKINSWAIRWTFSAFENKMYTVYPKISRVSVGGFGNGTHCGKNAEALFATDLATRDTPKCVFPEEIYTDEKIRKEFREKEMSKSTWKNHEINRIKRLIKKTLGY